MTTQAEQEAVELYRKYRPQNFDEFVGQDDIIDQVESWLDNKRVPHFQLATGPSGTGKTTLFRILKKELNCSDLDYKELNAASDRGIDVIREIQSGLGRFPMNGDCRIYMVDECFPKGTLVATPNGGHRIEQLKAGDAIINASGETSVKKVFKNKVSLERLVCIHFSDGSKIVTTKEHRFLTTNGWIEAVSLRGHLLYKEYSKDGKKQKTEANRNLSCMQVRVSEEDDETVMLFKELRTTASSAFTDYRKTTNRREGLLSAMRHCRKTSQKVLQPTVLLGLSIKSRGNANQNTSYAGQNPSEEIVVRGDSRSCEAQRGKLQQDAQQQSYEQLEEYRQDDEHKEKQRNSSCVERVKGRQRHDNSSRICDDRSLGRVCLEIPNNHPDWRETFGGIRIPESLQGGLWKRRYQTSNRDRWEDPQVEVGYLQRCEEDKTVEQIRVESVEVYQRSGRTDSFRGVVRDRERRAGFVEMYDLEIRDHASYKVNGMLVHNCHQLTSQAQEAFLKSLEDTPTRVYFFFATTNPSKLIKTIKTRASELVFKPLAPHELQDLATNVYNRETKKALPADVAKKLAEVADGSARKTLVLLHQVLHMDMKDEDAVLNAIQSKDTDAQAIEICRAILNNKSWPTVAAILKEVTEEPETVRRIMLGYMVKVVLSGGKFTDRASAIITEFEKPFYDSGMAGLVNACYYLSK